MTREELLAGLAALNAPDQGMNYFGGGCDHDGPKFDAHSGERLMPRFRPATLTLAGERARFIYRLISEAEATAAALSGSADNG